MVCAFFIVFLHEFVPLFLAIVHRIVEAAEGEKISSSADSISLIVSKLKRAPWPRPPLFIWMAVFSFEIMLMANVCLTFQGLTVFLMGLS